MDSMAELTALERELLNAMAPASRRSRLGSVLANLVKLSRMFSEKVTPANAVAATGKLTIAVGNAANDNTLTVGSVTYKFKTALSDPAAANEILIGADASGTAANILLAIAAAGTAGEVGVKYGTGTVPHPLVGATAEAGVVTFTAKTKGAAGNSIALAKVGDNLTVTGAKLGTGAGATAGVDGTVGEKGDFAWDDTYIYRCKADNTVADANWVKMGSFQ